MVKFLYFPGCSLKSYAENYEKSALAVAKHLGIELVELPRWNCCGVVYGLSSDSLAHYLGAFRDLIRAQENIDKTGNEYLVALCSMCYQVLGSLNHRLMIDRSALETLNKFMDDEEDYLGTIKVEHFLNILKDYVGFEKIKENVKRDLSDLRVAAYYGCMLVRPKEIAIDDPEDPKLLDLLIQAVGAELVDYPFKTECCGSYNVVVNKDVIKERAIRIFGSLARKKVDIVITVCPLCHFNLEQGLKLASEEIGKPNIKILYFTELLAIALGLDDVVDNSLIEELSLREKALTTP